MAFHLGPRTRLAVRYVGLTFATLFVFVIALQLSFPYDRIKTKLVDALADKYDVTVGDIERSWVPGRFSIKALTLRTRPAKADDLVTTFFIERLDVNLHFLPALHGTGSVDIDAKIAAGHIAGNIAIGKSGTSVHLEGSSLPAASLPMKEALGLPMSGKIEFSVALDLPNETNKAGKRSTNWSAAEGEIDFSCPTGCSIGDGKTKLKPKLKNARQQAFANDGITFGKVDVQSLFAEVEITPGPGDDKPGQLKLKRFDLKSLDGDLKVDFAMTLTPDINDSPVTGCLRFQPSAVLEKREPTTAAELTTTGAQRGPDGLFHIKLTDKFRDIKRLPQTCGPETNTNMDSPGGIPGPNGKRPNLAAPADKPQISVQPQAQVNPPAPPPAVFAPPTPVGGSAAPGSGSAAPGSGIAGEPEHEAPPPGGEPAAGSAPPPPEGTQPPPPPGP